MAVFLHAMTLVVPCSHILVEDMATKIETRQENEFECYILRPTCVYAAMQQAHVYINVEVIMVN